MTKKSLIADIFLNEMLAEMRAMPIYGTKVKSELHGTSMLIIMPFHKPVSITSKYVIAKSKSKK